MEIPAVIIGMTLEARSGPSNGRAQSRPRSRLEELQTPHALPYRPRVSIRQDIGPCRPKHVRGKPATYFDVCATAGKRFVSSIHRSCPWPKPTTFELSCVALDVLPSCLEMLTSSGTDQYSLFIRLMSRGNFADCLLTLTELR